MGDQSPIMAYRQLVSHSSTLFRGDVEFHEQPRQILFGLLLLGMTVVFAMINSVNGENPAAAAKVAIVAAMVSVIFYCMLQSKDGLMV